MKLIIEGITEFQYYSGVEKERRLAYKNSHLPIININFDPLTKREARILNGIACTQAIFRIFIRINNEADFVFAKKMITRVVMIIIQDNKDKEVLITVVSENQVHYSLKLHAFITNNNGVIDRAELFNPLYIPMNLVIKYLGINVGELLRGIYRKLIRFKSIFS